MIHMSEIGLDVPDGHTDTIELDGGISIKMKYPSMDEFLKNNFSVTQETKKDMVDEAFKAVAKCIDTVFTEEEAWSASDCTQAELVKFIEQLSSAQFQKIENFFSSMPKLRYEGKVTNPNTEVVTDVVVEGMSNFFG